jgi:hypothetical protein
VICTHPASAGSFLGNRLPSELRCTVKPNTEFQIFSVS